MQKIFDSRYNTEIQLIGPGEFYVSKDGEVICTTLGSCVSVCLFDQRANAGGMNHFMLPESSLDGESISLKKGVYGINAMEEMINQLLTAGAKRENLKAKVFGGANMFSKIVPERSGITVGEQNVAFAKRYLIAEGIPIRSEDIGLDHARRVYFDCATNKVKLHRMIENNEKSVITEQEKQFQDSFSKPKDEKKVTFF